MYNIQRCHIAVYAKSSVTAAISFVFTGVPAMMMHLITCSLIACSWEKFGKACCDNTGRETNDYTPVSWERGVSNDAGLHARAHDRTDTRMRRFTERIP